MSTANERLSQRLRELPSDVLADVLLKLTKGNPALKRELVALTSDSKEKVGAVKRAIAGMRRSKTFYDNHQARKLRDKLDVMLWQIDTIAKTAPSNAFELLCELHASEEHIDENVDDSMDVIGQIFRIFIPKLAASITARYRDDAHMTKWLNVALQEDPFNSGCYLVDAIATTVPEAVLKTLADNITIRVDQLPRMEFENRNLAFVQRRLLVALGDTEQFIACCTYKGSMSEPDVETLIQMYLDHEQNVNAQFLIDMLAKNRSARLELSRGPAVINKLNSNNTNGTSL